MFLSSKELSERGNADGTCEDVEEPSTAVSGNRDSDHEEIEGQLVPEGDEQSEEKAKEAQDSEGTAFLAEQYA